MNHWQGPEARDEWSQDPRWALIRTTPLVPYQVRIWLCGSDVAGRPWPKRCAFHGYWVDRPLNLFWSHWMLCDNLKGRIRAEPCTACDCVERYKRKPRECPACSARRSKMWRDANLQVSRQNARDRVSRLKLTEVSQVLP